MRRALRAKKNLRMNFSEHPYQLTLLNMKRIYFYYIYTLLCVFAFASLQCSTMFPSKPQMKLALQTLALQSDDNGNFFLGSRSFIMIIKTLVVYHRKNSPLERGQGCVLFVYHFAIECIITIHNKNHCRHFGAGRNLDSLEQ